VENENVENETSSAKVGAPELPRKRRVAPRIRLGAVIAVAAAVGFVAWLVLRDHTKSTPNTQKSTVAAVSLRGLKTLAGSLKTPIYWAGPKAGTTYELTQTPSGNIFVRYLPNGVSVGTAKQYPFVATFRVPNSFAVTRGVANRPDSGKIQLGTEVVAFYSRSSPTNVYLAYSGSNYQIEVFDPNPRRARQTVALGRIEPVSLNSQGSTAPIVTAATLARLKNLPGKLGHPVYWTGARAGKTYELTQTADGRVYVRYLPAGLKVGSSVQYPFVATFPVPNAFTATRNAAQGPDSVKVPVAGGAVAFYSQSSPTNVYLAFRGSDYQIEVFDPDPRHARALVHTGHVRPIP
jgi:hypothetical protein